VERGLDVDDFAGRLSFFFNAHNDFFEEVAKFRAARRMWARLLRERFGARNDEAMRLRFHTQTAGSTLTSRQPDVNVVRVTLQALAAVLGGTQSLHTNSFDEALGLPGREAALLALRTQQVLAHESGVTDTVDPLAGSYFVESLTAELAGKATALIETIDAQGGMIASIAAGWVQEEIHRAAYRWQREVESGERIVVGVNRFADEQPAPPPFQQDPSVERERARFLARWRSERPQKAANAALTKLERDARGTENLMPAILGALQARATLGEVCDTMRDVFGTHRPGAER
jgi:methylmalonyl-CoA mutase N-terminal domain/subunit